jgi:hypothetical protein
MITGTTFINNNATNNTDDESSISGYGGGIYYTCDSTNNCEVNITSGNNIASNYAENSGGGIYWDQVEPNFDDNNTFNSNEATLYGDDIASFA